MDLLAHIVGGIVTFVGGMLAGWQSCQSFHRRRHRRDDYAPWRRKDDPIMPLPVKPRRAPDDQVREFSRRIDQLFSGRRKP